jgi:hypothetical protein
MASPVGNREHGALAKDTKYEIKATSISGFGNYMWHSSLV